MVGEPLGSAAAGPFALVFIPQPRFTVGLPEKVKPVATVFFRLMTQYLPSCTIAAVAAAVIVGAVLMNRLEKDSDCWAVSVTFTALEELDVQAPEVGGA